MYEMIFQFFNEKFIVTYLWKLLMPASLTENG